MNRKNTQKLPLWSKSSSINSLAKSRNPVTRIGITKKTPPSLRQIGSPKLVNRSLGFQKKRDESDAQKCWNSTKLQICWWIHSSRGRIQTNFFLQNMGPSIGILQKCMAQHDLLAKERYCTGLLHQQFPESPSMKSHSYTEKHTANYSFLRRHNVHLQYKISMCQHDAPGKHRKVQFFSGNWIAGFCFVKSWKLTATAAFTSSNHPLSVPGRSLTLASKDRFSNSMGSPLRRKTLTSMKKTWSTTTVRLAMVVLTIFFWIFWLVKNPPGKKNENDSYKKTLLEKKAPLFFVFCGGLFRFLPGFSGNSWNQCWKASWLVGDSEGVEIQRKNSTNPSRFMYSVVSHLWDFAPTKKEVKPVPHPFKFH